MKWLVSLIIQMVAFSLIFGSNIPHSTQLGLVILSLVANFWMAELLPLSVTALLVPVLAAGLGVMDFKTALLSFAHPIIFLFLGGFALAAALHEHKIDHYLAHWIIQRAKNGLVMCLVLFSLTGFMSMWISNTATAVMMLPIALGLVGKINYEQHKNIYAFLLLGVAYSANIGGMATVVGSPPNAIAASALNLSFNDWLSIAMPISLLLLPIMWGILYGLCKPDLSLFNQSTSSLDFHWTRQKVQVISIFLITACAWIFGGFIQKHTGKIASYDSWVAVIAIIVLHGSKSLSWKTFEKQTQWGILLLFGGGLALSAILSETQANLFLANKIAYLADGIGLFWLLLLILMFVIFMTEISSNTALAALMIPTFMGLADVLGFNQTLIVCAIAIGASCAFMLPVATPPNAVVYSSGYIPQNRMMKIGFTLNVCFAVLIVLWLTWLI
ncbi:DASS family sodium-coupled anion symporter [Oceaniserpentilla sp. 4NH20-0058]|uniref:SLC13 family permease n=1 Tax=Oceaniserpentilla sp. 4NH20-0058 TaxID=3127660 RepID=UPI0031075915